MKDPKQIVDSFRTDVRSRNIYSDLLRQFDLERPNRGRNRRKFQPFKNQSVKNSAAILSLCLVTGLSVGTGSAFADNEIAPDTAPLDQPSRQVKVDTKQPTKHERKVERSLKDMAPQEPQVEKSDKNLKAESSQIKEKLNSSEIAPDDLPPKEVPTQNTSTNQPKTPKKEKTVSKPQASDTKSRSSQGEKSAKSTVKNQSKQNTKAITGGGSGTVKSETSTYNEAPKDQPNQTEELLVASAGSNQTTASITSSSNQPQTVNGGKLPDTAGNDLNGVLTGVGMALLGSIYALRRGRTKKS